MSAALIAASAGLGVFVTCVALIFLGALMRGWVLSYLWAWFLVPLGAPPLTFSHAVGVAFVIVYLTHQWYPAEQKRSWSEIISNALTYSLIAPLSVLAIAWLLARWLP